MKTLTYLAMMTAATAAVMDGGGDAAEKGAAPGEVKPEAEAIRSAVVPDGEKAMDAASEAAAAAAPVPVPPLSHYAALWQRSMFTTHELPAPEMPQGPGFADQLVLAGTYEVDGALVAVILDKMTAQVSEARIGSDNELGIRIKSVSPGESASATRIQLQKGMQSGWIQVAEASPAAAPATGQSGAGQAAGGAAVPGMAPAPFLPGGAGAAAAAPGDGGGGRGVGGAGGAIVQPLPAPANANSNAPVNPSPGGVATPNPNLDDIPLPPD